MEITFKNHHGKIVIKGGEFIISPKNGALCCTDNTVCNTFSDDLSSSHYLSPNKSIFDSVQGFERRSHNSLSLSLNLFPMLRWQRYEITVFSFEQQSLKSASVSCTFGYEQQDKEYLQHLILSIYYCRLQ